MSRWFLPAVAILLGVLNLPVNCQAQTALETYRIYAEHPRLFLKPQRLRLLTRERERKSLRWQQFQLLMAGGAPMPEPGFAGALYFRVAGDKKIGRNAVEWAIRGGHDAPARDLRQAAIVYDWCQDLLTPAEKQTLLAYLHAGMLNRSSNSLDSWRSRILAAAAVGDDDAATVETTLRTFIHDRWLGNIVPALRHGNAVLRGSDNYALLEIFHAIRDNLNADLREDDPPYFRSLPVFDLLSYYPAEYPAAENEFRIPFSETSGEPDLRLAALSRAAELAMVAFDTNSPETQVLQGWLTNDNFLMRGTFGVPYEFLWANPYQPGLSYYHVPLVLHDETFGRLIVRSSWEDSARWLGLIDGHLQMFSDGQVTLLDPRKTNDPIDLDEAVIYFAPSGMKLVTGVREANDIFIVNLKPNAAYHVEVDDEEMREEVSDPGGILYMKGMRPRCGIRINLRSIASDLQPATGR